MCFLTDRSAHTGKSVIVVFSDLKVSHISENLKCTIHNKFSSVHFNERLEVIPMDFYGSNCLTLILGDFHAIYFHSKASLSDKCNRTASLIGIVIIWCLLLPPHLSLLK